MANLTTDSTWYSGSSLSGVSLGTTSAYHDITSAAISDITSAPVSDITSTPVSDVSTHIFDTYTVFIHPHWRNFPMVSDEWHYLIGVYITIVGFTGIIGNSLVIWMFTSEKSLRTSSNMFIVNLAISDLTFSVVNGFPLLTFSAFNKKWIFGQAACEFYGLIGGIFGLMSVNTMATISIDRYFAIARPLHVAKFMTRKRAFLMIAGVWIWSFATSLPPIFGWGRYIPEGFQTSCTFDYLTRTDNNRTYIFFLYLFGFAVPLAIIAVCYSLIIRAVRKHEIEMKKTAKKLNAEMRTNQDKKNMEIRVAKISMAILVLYMLSWMPYATVALIGQFGNADFVTPFWSEIPVMFAKASAMHNPLVYALSHPKFRAAIQKRLPWLSCCCKTETLTSAPTGTFRETNASKRSVSSVTGAASVSSEMSNLSDTYADVEFRLRKLEEERGTRKDTKTSSRRNAFKSSKSLDQIDDISAGQIIQDLTKALIEISSRERSQEPRTQPLYLPSSVLQKSTGETREGVFVLDSSSLPELAKYLAQVSNTSAGVQNRAMEMSPETPTDDCPRDLGARPKEIVSNACKEDEAQL